MGRLALGIVCFLCWSVPGVAADRGKQDECARIDREIREIQAQMRQGYNASKGEKLEARLRELRARRAKICR
jgi:hypothetical protein